MDSNPGPLPCGITLDDETCPADPPAAGHTCVLVDFDCDGYPLFANNSVLVQTGPKKQHRQRAKAVQLQLQHACRWAAVHLPLGGQTQLASWLVVSISPDRFTTHRESCSTNDQ